MPGGAKAVCASQTDWTSGPTNTGTSSARTFTVDGTPPTVSNFVVTNGGTLGRIDKGDTVAVTFSEATNPASVCTGWNGTSLSVIVTVTDNDPTTAGNDSLSITGTPCAGATLFNFGKVNLGSPNWVTATRSYSGGGGNASFSLANTKLTITLGTGTAGTAGVPARTVIYTPSTAITDAVGNAISGAYTFINQRF